MTKRFASSMSPFTSIVSRGAPPWTTAASLGGRRGEDDVAILGVAALDIEPAVMER